MCNDEYDPMLNTPEVRVEMATRDCFLAAHELVRLRNDPLTRELVGKEEADLWSALNAVQFVLSSIRIEQDNKRSAA